MEIASVFKSYFSLNELATFKNNKATTNCVAVLKIFSYLTVAVPLAFIIAYAISLCGRICKREKLTPQDDNIQDIATRSNIVNPPSRDAGNATYNVNEEKVEDKHTAQHTQQQTTAKSMEQSPESQKPQTNKSVVVHKNIEISVFIHKNICDLEIDAIVNAANGFLAPGSGVCGDIQRYGGDEIFLECQKHLEANHKNRLEDGEAMITTGGNLKAKFVIHAVGPIWNEGAARPPESERAKAYLEFAKGKLYNAYYNSLSLAAEKKLESIAFPSISTGIFGFPLQQAAETAIQAVKDFAEKNENENCTIKKVYMPVWADKYEAYSSNLVKIKQITTQE